MFDRRRSTAVVAAALGVLAIVGAIAYAADSFDTGGDARDSSAAAGAPHSTVAADVELIGSGLVLESPDHGPEFCLGSVDDSYPPQCGGPRLVGWDWSAVDGDTHASGSIFGDYVVIGTYDSEAANGGSFMPTRPPVPTDQYDGSLPGPQWPEVDFTSPCDPPPGGWAVVDESTATNQALNETNRRASQLNDLGTIWVDQSINPASEDPNDPDADLNNPRKLVLNVSVTGDVDATTDYLRETWGGALCVSHAEHTGAELRAISEQACAGNAMTGCGTGLDYVDIYVFYDNGSLQQQFDEQYGTGAVRVTSALRPYPGD